ncbi:NUDIX domain-containing protein [Tamlana sp. 62-3]|uniref:NUDIX domain-containing protein n=1 Tax=Neotamlana sargassicola TaxID=2883125 RepID=A0A9X1L5C7_9FLAO|nr:NUDIX domain-containing protein [Tamlana sargassicola]MCB4809107.1 NUDIX domain-containing protein [Tamlana sargassicola]
MDELIDIVDKNGIPTGETALKSVIHAEGLLHNTAHLWLYTKTGDILLSQRSAKKLICPLLWDVSVAGHIDAGETAEEACLRETCEEIGLKLNETDLEKIGAFKCFQSYDYGVHDNEFHNTFIAELKVPITKLTPQEDEVEALKLVSLPHFENIINSLDVENNNHLVASNKDYYLIILNKIKAKLS